MTNEKINRVCALVGTALRGIKSELETEPAGSVEAAVLGEIDGALVDLGLALKKLRPLVRRTKPAGGN